MADNELVKEFKAVVTAYIGMHDQLAEAGKQMREIRKKKAELADVIVQYMKKNDIEECELQDGKLVRKEAKRLEPLKKEHILEELARAVGTPRAEDIMVNIYSKRNVTNHDTLKRTKKRGGGDAAA